MPLVAGVDSSTQSCKVVVVDTDTGHIVRTGRAPHPDGTEVAPAAWAAALDSAVEAAGGIDDVAAVSVAGQQHGMVALNEAGAVVRDALLWNDTRSAAQASELIAWLGDGDAEVGAREWVRRTGSVPVASFTVTKLAWLQEHEPDAAASTAAVALPHDWLTWRLLGGTSPVDLVTDRSDASGTGYWNPLTGEYDDELLTRALGHRPMVPRVLAADAPAGSTAGGVLVGPGCGDNAAAALGLGAEPGTVVVSVGTSGVVTAVAVTAAADPTGVVNGFADATGRFLPLVCTLNAARVLDATAGLLGVSHHELDQLAGLTPPGNDGLVLVPYLEGERTPNEPLATGAWHGLRLDTMSPQHLARSAFEGVACSLAHALDQIRDLGVDVDSVVLVGGAARSHTLRQSLADLMAVPVTVPDPGEYVAIGAARQAAWVAGGTATPPTWRVPQTSVCEPRPGVPVTEILERYAQAATRFLPRAP